MFMQRTGSKSDLDQFCCFMCTCIIAFYATTGMFAKVTFHNFLNIFCNYSFFDVFDTLLQVFSNLICIQTNEHKTQDRELR